MSGTAPTLINIPAPPSDPVTPSEAGPGTPNSTTTSMSELSTVAIKDGHRGHPHSHHAYDKQAPLSNLDTERADRISRLPGLERLTDGRQSSSASIPPGGSARHPQGFPFGSQAAPSHAKERSTVGSASATGSVGGRTTWASGSGSEPTDAGDTADKMSMSEDMETGSDGGASDENASLVGFGEGASSTMSGPTSTGVPGMTRIAQRGSYNTRSSTLSAEQARDPRNIDGMTYDNDNQMVDTVNSTPPAVTSNERIMDRLDSNDVQMTEPIERADGRKDLGEFEFERRK